MKKNIKQILVISLCLVAVIFIVACNKQENTVNESTALNRNKANESANMSREEAIRNNICVNCWGCRAEEGRGLCSNCIEEENQYKEIIESDAEADSAH